MDHEPKRRPILAEAIEARVAQEVESAERYARRLGHDEAEVQRRREDADQRMRERLAKWQVRADRAKLVEIPDIVQFLDVMCVQQEEPLTMDPDEVEQIMRASLARKLDDREVAWQVIQARRRGYPYWFHVTCQPQPRTAGPETREVYERNRRFEEERPQFESTMMEAMRRLFREELPAQLAAGIREARVPSIY